MTNENPPMEDPRFEVQVIPHNLEAEQSLLGAVLVNNLAMEGIIDFLEPKHFINQAHQDIYSEFVKLFSSDKFFSPVTLVNKFKDHPELKEIGGSEYLARLATAAVSIINTPQYGKMIHDLAVRRMVIETTQVASLAAYDTSDKTGSEIVEETQQALNGMHSAETMGEELLHISDGIDEELADIIHGIENGVTMSGITTGLKGLDAKTGGMGDGQLWIIAGRPAMGKTALALNIAKGACKDGYTGAFFSIEMQRLELRERMVSDLIYNSHNPIKYFDIKNRNVDKFEIPRLQEGFERMKEMSLFISDRGGTTVKSVRREARRLNRSLSWDKTIDFIVIDYLQLMQGSTRRQTNRVLEIGEITGALKRLAKELKIPIILLSQLSRALEQRDDKRPILSDLRESGSIEQDADTVIFVYREHYYIKDRVPKKNAEEWQEKVDKCENKIDLIISKQRRGPTGIVKLDCHLHSNVIRDGFNDRLNGV